MTWTYEQWNAFLIGRLFNWEQADSLVYVLLDDDDIAEAAATMGIAHQDVIPNLAAATHQKMRFSSRRNEMFGWFASQIYFWNFDMSRATSEDDLPEPPVVALLALFSEAAKEMGTVGMSSANFYGPLAEILGLDNQDRTVVSHLADSYRNVVNIAWACVEQWCKENEGQRGLCSVFSANGFPYVSLAVSQALIRQHDRIHLPDFFRQYRLSANASMEPAELEEALGEWLTSPGSSASQNFRRVWINKHARPRAIEIVLRELDQWTGETQANSTPRLILEASLSLFPKLGISWSMVIENTNFEDQSAATLTVGNEECEIIMSPTLDAELYIDIHDNHLSSNSNLIFVRSEISVANGIVASRAPRRLVILVKNLLSGRFEETPQLGLGQVSIIVVNGPLEAEAVRRLLHMYADTGWKEIALSRDFAQAGVAFANVRIESQGFKASSEWLQPLSPKNESALSIQGGLDLGRQSWLLTRPPHIVATVAGGAPYQLRLLRIDEGQTTLDVTAGSLQFSEAGAQIMDKSLQPGRYRVELLSQPNEEVLRTANLRLVTSDTRDVRSWRRSSRLVRDFTADGAIAAITAAPAKGDSGVTVEGSSISNLGTAVAIPSSSRKILAWWTTESDVERQMARRTDDTTDAPADWQDAVEALMYLGGGSTRALTSVARQVMPSEEFAAWRFWRACSDLAHIEVTLDRGLSPKAWRLVRPQLAGTMDGNWLLCGYWPRKAVRKLEQKLTIPLRQEQPSHGPASLLIDGLSVNAVERIIAEIGIDATVSPKAAEQLIEVLPTIGELAEALPSTHLPEFDVIHQYDPVTRRYSKVNRISEIGAYRTWTGGMQRFVVVTPKDLSERRCHFADADLAKHISASMHGHPFLAYHPGERFLVTPFGIRLPHLYGRVATLCSGHLSKTMHNSWTVYMGVPQSIALAMHSLLAWKV